MCVVPRHIPWSACQHAELGAVQSWYPTAAALLRNHHSCALHDWGLVLQECAGDLKQSDASRLNGSSVMHDQNMWEVVRLWVCQNQFMQPAYNGSYAACGNVQLKTDRRMLVCSGACDQQACQALSLCACDHYVT